VGASREEAPAHEDCLVLVLGLPGVDVNLQDTNGDTALQFAAFKGAWRCIKVLLAAPPRIDVNMPSNKGQTPLHGAVACGHPKCVELLLQAPGIKINNGQRSFGIT
jgi:ankyrin repeat protein